MTANKRPQKPRPSGWGPISRYAAANLLRLRTARGLSTTRLSDAMKEVGHSIPPTGITRIEKGERRVDLDDLVALAVALRVSPTALLLPPSVVGEVDVAPAKTVKAVDAWMWLTSRRPLEAPEGREDEGAALDDHQVHSLPPGLRKWRPQTESDATTTLEDLARTVADVERIPLDEARRRVRARAEAGDVGGRQ